GRVGARPFRTRRARGPGDGPDSRRGAADARPRPLPPPPRPPGRIRNAQPSRRPPARRRELRPMTPSLSKAKATTSAGSAESSRQVQPARFREGWLHLCNGLDPVRDGGMVPSILGMTGGLAEYETAVTIVTPTPSRLGMTPIPPRVNLRGPETDLEA